MRYANALDHTATATLAVSDAGVSAGFGQQLTADTPSETIVVTDPRLALDLLLEKILGAANSATLLAEVGCIAGADFWFGRPLKAAPEPTHTRMAAAIAVGKEKGHPLTFHAFSCF